ncbi:MAG: flagellin [Clostridium sp.]|nr:flagellin [Clostridium sp.]
MAIIVNTNMSSLKTQRNLTSATNSLNTALERMSTGLKINRAADDAAGMFVANNLETQIRGSKIAQSNVATGINVLQTVEGNLDVINENLLRIRDLCVQGANGVYDAKSYTAMKNEIDARLAEITRISASADFNGKKLLDGSITTDLTLQVGANGTTNDRIAVTKDVFAKADATTLVGSATATFASTADATTLLGKVDTAISNVAERKATIGATQNRLTSAQDSLVTTIENATAAKSTIMDADIAEESANYTKAQILQQTSATLLVQANQLPSMALTLVRQ